jgi:hypothetical protein
MGGYNVIENIIILILGVGFVGLPALILLAVFIIIWTWEPHDD